MTGMLFSEPNKRKPYRAYGYRSKLALENTDSVDEGLVADEFEGDLTNDPLEDLVDHAWAVDPEEEVINFEEEFEREEDTLTNTASRISYMGFPYNNLQEQPFLSGHKWPTYLYRGLVIAMPSDVEAELDLAVMDGDQREMYRIGKNILSTISSKGMGRHWTTEPDIAMDFARMNASNGNLAVVLSVVWERDGEDLATEHEGYDGVKRPSRLVGEEEVTLERGTRIKVISMKASRVGSEGLLERDFSLDLLDTPQTKMAKDWPAKTSRRVANDSVLDSLNPTGTIFTDYTPEDRASRDLAPNIRPYSDINGVDPDERMVVYRGVPKGLQSDLADGDFITDMEQLAKDYAGTGDVISQEVFSDEILDDDENPMAGEYLFRPRKTSKRAFHRRIAEDYFMEHRPAGPSNGSPMHDVSYYFPDIETLPRNVYDDMQPGGQDSIQQIIDTQGSPDNPVTIYRGVPKGVDPVIRNGDWVTISRDYAVEHGYHFDEPDVLSATVQAKDLWTSGDSVNEFGYWGDSVDSVFDDKTSSRRVAVDSETSSPQTLYRGVRLDLDPEDSDRFRQTVNKGISGFSLEDIGSELTVGPEILDRMEEYGGLGTHWSTRPEIAERFSLQSNGNGGGIPVMLTTEWDGSGQDHDRTGVGGEWTDEAEVTLLPGTPLNVNSVTFGSSFGDGYEVLNTDKYDRYTDDFTSQGLQTPKGGPQSRFANKKNSDTKAQPGNLYRGLGTDSLTNDEYDQIVDWAKDNEFDPDNFTMVQPNYEVIQPILQKLEEKQGLGRHWSTDYDVAKGFAKQRSWGYDYDPFKPDPDSRPPLGIVFRGDWGGEGEDFAEEHTGYDGVVRPSNLPEEKEVTLHPDSEVNLLGIEVFEPGGFDYEIPVPDVPIYSNNHLPNRKREKVSAVNSYLRFAKARGMNPHGSETPRLYRRASRNLSPDSMVEISQWLRAQKTANSTAREVLATTRSYRHKISSSWHLDNKLNAYISKVQQKFACSCGSKLEVPSYSNCKCGKVWNSYKVSSSTKGDTMFVVREVPVRENVVIANKTASRRRKKANPSLQDMMGQFPDWQVTDDREDTWQIESPDRSDVLVGESDGTYTWTTDSDTEYEEWRNTPNLDEALEEIDAAGHERKHRQSSRNRHTRRTRRGYR